MPSVAILNSHPVSVLKKEISKTNIKGYSKMKKPELVALMMKEENKPRFKHIKMREGKSAPAPKVVVEKKKPVEKTAGQKLTGLTKEEMNKLSPLELFGKLPVGVAAKKVLNPKATGVKVGDLKTRNTLLRKKSDELEAQEKARLNALGKSFTVKDAKALLKERKIDILGVAYMYKRKPQIIDKIAEEYGLKNSGYRKFRKEVLKIEKKLKQDFGFGNYEIK